MARYHQNSDEKTTMYLIAKRYNSKCSKQQKYFFSNHHYLELKKYF